MRFDVVDVSDWTVVSQEPEGAEPKDWLTRPEDVGRAELDRLWLYKSVKVGTTFGYPTF